MARKKSPTLTDAELRLMNVLWERGAATVGEVVEALPIDDAVAYSTVLTTLRILEQKGYLHHRKEGRAYVYEAVVDQGEARRSTVDYVVNRLFGGSHGSLVLNVMEREQLSEADLGRLKRMIEESES